MINFLLEGHSLSHEVQTMVQVFFPNKHYYEKNAIQPEGITVVSQLTGAFSCAQVYEDGVLKGEKQQRYTPEELTPREQKRIIKLSIYYCLVEFTNYRPTWGIITGIRPAKTVNELLDEGFSQDYAYSFLKDKYLAKEEKVQLTIDVANAERQILSENTQKQYSLYIGIPFCPTRCIYCSFTSYPLDRYANMVDSYVEKLILELKYIAKNTKAMELDTVYIGGGTPTSLTHSQLEKLLCCVEQNFDIKNVREYTVEAGRADTITKAKLQVLKKYNVGRISVNPQTMNDETLKLIGRNHSASDVKNVYKMALEEGFDNINMDLILGLPNETEADVIKTMEEIQALNPASITVHTLAIKRASRLKEEMHTYHMAETQLMERMLEISYGYAQKMGMKPYYMYRQKNMLGNFENVGYCKEGYESIYNIEIMEEKQTIIGAGAGSTSKIYNSKTNQITRIFNVKGVEEYLGRFEEMLERKEKGIFNK